MNFSPILMIFNTNNLKIGLPTGLEKNIENEWLPFL